MTDITVYKLDENGREVWHYPAHVLERTADGIRLEAPFNRDDMDLGYTTFARGDRFVSILLQSLVQHLCHLWAKNREPQGLVLQCLSPGRDQ
ncbi:MAG: hypothetical protein R3C44_14225 [Chloroflexota bacterium]